MIELDAQKMHYKEMNEWINRQISEGKKKIILKNIVGQRFIADGIKGNEEIQLEIHGTPGNDLSAFMNGITVRVYGNAQDGIGNTMNEGKVYIHGDAGDVLFYGMRGGEVYIKGNAGYRVGIHMKEYMDFVPKAVIGGKAGDFFGEYMAGGILVLLGLNAEKDEYVAGDYIATGIHGGRIYIRGDYDADNLGKETRPFELDEADFRLLKPLVQNFCKEFDYPEEEVWKKKFTKLIPVSRRPYGKHYVPGWHSLTERRTIVPGSFESNQYPKIRNIRYR